MGKAWGAEACPIIGHYLIAGVCVRCGWSPPADSRTIGVNGRCDRPCKLGRTHDRDCVNYFDPPADAGIADTPNIGR